MGKDENIVLAGLIFENNLGDQAIYKCSKQMLKESLKKNGKSHVVIRGMDLMGRNPLGESLRSSLKKSFLWRQKRKICRYIGKLFPAVPEWNRKREELVITLKQVKKYADRNTIAIMLSGGGIIKYKYQDFYLYIDAVTRFAELKKIPVFISAAGVEGYDVSDAKCRRLERALNRSCVRMITTRDDIATLQKCYRKSNWECALVADPACSMSDFYPIPKSFFSKKRIGLGVVREGLFVDNNVSFSKQQMIDFWQKLYVEFVSRGYECFVFCNGAKSDYLFAQELADCLHLKKDNLIPRPQTLGQLLDNLNTFTGVVVGRLHASILSYSYGIPAIGLVWNNKQILFGKAIDCEGHFFEVSKLNVKCIASALEAAIEKGYNEEYRYKYRRTTMEYVDKFIASL